MSASTKVLIILIAIFAFAIGWVVNSAQVESEFTTTTMLQAELLATDGQDAVTTGRVEDQLRALTLVNFWATWCAPCREEMPMFESMYRQFKPQGFQVVGITIDSMAKARPMLDSMDITYPILYAEQTGMQIMDSVGNPNGLLPYSLLLDDKGAMLEQKVGAISADDVANWIAKHL